MQYAGAVEGRRIDLVAGTFADRRAFSSQQGLVDRRLAAFHHPVDGYLVPGRTTKASPLAQ